jgi:hypothetical protein
MMQTARRDALRVMISTGHLGTAPSGIESFMAGIETCPDYLVADGGSADPGPVYLGENIELGHFVREELELFLVESRRRGIPLIIGSAGDSGSNAGVDATVRMIREIAAEHRIPRFRLGWFHSEIPGDFLAGEIEAGHTIRGLGSFADLTAEEARAATRIVAVAGNAPFLELLDQGAEVIVGGRCGDANFTAAPCIHAGFPPALAVHMGKMIECASLVATPFMGKETVIGTITRDDIRITPYHPDQRVTVASAAAHSMYERETPYFEHTAEGTLDMRDCRYEQVEDRVCRITGARFEPWPVPTVKLEGVQRLGERYMGLAAVRDPHVIAHIDTAIAWSRSAIERRFPGGGYELHYHVFGRDGILKEREPLRDRTPHEVAVMVETLHPDDATAAKITDLAVRMFFLARIPGVKGTSGASATSKLPMKYLPGYVWSINHTMEVRADMGLFPTTLDEAGV